MGAIIVSVNLVITQFDSLERINRGLLQNVFEKKDQQERPVGAEVVIGPRRCFLHAQPRRKSRFNN